MNIIIAGCGGVGSTLAEQLTAEGHEITIIDQESKNIQAVTAQYDVMGVLLHRWKPGLIRQIC